MRYGLIAICAATMLGGPVLADPWKDESGKGRWGHERRGYRAYIVPRVQAGIPTGKLQDRAQVGTQRRIQRRA